MSMAQRKVAAVTGTRAEFGLLEPVMRAIEAHPDLQLLTFCAGAHFLAPANTWTEVAAKFAIHARIDMQLRQHTGRLADSRALGRGIIAMTDALERFEPDWVLVLGDRIEALAAATASSIGGIALAHIHGGDRAEGIADEAMRHAITKLAHAHFPATEQSADRIERLGEPRDRIHLVGSPAVATLADVEPLDDDSWRALGEPRVLVLLHPAGLGDRDEHLVAEALARAIEGTNTLWLHPNHDAGREAIMRVIESAGTLPGVTVRDHLPTHRFRALVRRLALSGGVVVGNSSAGLIECAALRCPVVDIGPRQGGRERPDNVVHIDEVSPGAVREAIEQARSLDLTELGHPYGSGDAPERIARVLAAINPHDPLLLRKRNTF